MDSQKNGGLIVGFSDNGPIRFTVRFDPSPSIADMRALIKPDFGIPGSLFEYRCPFDFIQEHDKWFEFHRRLYFEKESSHSIIRSMLYADSPNPICPNCGGDDLDHHIHARTYVCMKCQCENTEADCGGEQRRIG